MSASSSTRSIGRVADDTGAAAFVALNEIGEPDVIQFGERALKCQDFHDATLQIWDAPLPATDAGNAGYGAGLKGPAIWGLRSQVEVIAGLRNVRPADR